VRAIGAGDASLMKEVSGNPGAGDVRPVKTKAIGKFPISQIIAGIGSRDLHHWCGFSASRRVRGYLGVPYRSRAQVQFADERPLCARTFFKCLL
jgi:hypothetical protein